MEEVTLEDDMGNVELEELSNAEFSAGECDILIYEHGAGTNLSTYLASYNSIMRRMEAGRRERGRACKFPKIVASSFSQFHKLCLPCVVILENYYNTTCYRRLWRQPYLPREGLCLGALP